MVLFYCPVDWLPTQECLSTMGRSSVSDSLEPRWLIAHSHCCTFGIIGKLWFQLFDLIWTTWSLKAVWSFQVEAQSGDFDVAVAEVSIFLIIITISIIARSSTNHHHRRHRCWNRPIVLKSDGGLQRLCSHTWPGWSAHPPLPICNTPWHRPGDMLGEVSFIPFSINIPQP